jgi:hypothetical protein
MESLIGHWLLEAMARLLLLPILWLVSTPAILIRALLCTGCLFRYITRSYQRVTDFWVRYIRS